MGIDTMTLAKTLFSWNLIEEVSREDDRLKVRCTDVDLADPDDDYTGMIRYFIDNDYIEATEDSSIYVITEWFFNIAKEYTERTK
ncbi:hypothetical protein JOC34_000622 [Virgibacillus halotolerans]|uniref:hypothetical protein n=1 Tax=Virgibacillus halotolerans TaxID=1071053 RepID=UPI0019614D6A|nr:hypothetical protein [Virgibacillus halotolerans]MBM7598265.1 hypothetical protein [Virgibacillus halotolerans]